jgi:pimeloyl-ACP methyl ester carboxylesterase
MTLVKSYRLARPTEAPRSLLNISLLKSETLNWNGGPRTGEDHGLYKSAMERVRHGESSFLCAFPLAGMADRLGQRPGLVSDQSPTAGVSISRTHKFRGRDPEIRGLCAAESGAGPQVPAGRLPAWQVRRVPHERILQESGLRWWHEYDKDVQQEPTFLLAPVGGIGGWTSEARRQAVFELIDGLLQEFPIDQQRIYLMGFSLGGAGTWNYLQQRPGFFAAANPEALAGRDLDPEVLKNTPIWATIGINDEANRLEQLSTVVARIRAASGDPQGAATWVTGVNPRFTIFANTDHGGVQEKTQQIPGLRKWFYAQSNNGNTPPNVRFVRPLPLDEEYTVPVAALVKATDPDGKIDRMEFSIGDKVLFVAREDPFEYTFADLTPGTYTLAARAVDDGGKSNTAEVTIRVGASRKQESLSRNFRQILRGEAARCAGRWGR